MNLAPGNFTLVLLGILLWMVIYSVIRNIDLFKNYGAIWSALFALVVTVLAFKGFPPEFIEGIVIQYRAMGATIVTVIPFLIIFWFTIMTDSINLMFSRLVWLVYTIYYFSLFIYKIGSENASVGWFAAQNIPYIGAIIVGLIVLIFLGAIRGMAFHEKLKSGKEKGDNKIDKANMALETLTHSYDTINDS